MASYAPRSATNAARRRAGRSAHGRRRESGLAADPDFGVRQAVAANRSCPPETLDGLAADRVERVRETATANPSLPASAITRLSVGGDRQREAAAANPSCDRRLLRHLADDKSQLVRLAALTNH